MLGISGVDIGCVGGTHMVHVHGGIILVWWTLIYVHLAPLVHFSLQKPAFCSRSNLARCVCACVGGGGKRSRVGLEDQLLKTKEFKETKGPEETDDTKTKAKARTRTATKTKTKVK
jgi:hypothetical protein